MTKQCRDVLAACDFPIDAARHVERYVSRCTPRQVINLVWSKDKDGVHSADWFAPFFDNGYIKSKIDIQCSFDEAFWSAYDWLSMALDKDFSVFDFPLIDKMARDTKRMKVAFSKSRVYAIPYIYKVYEGTQETKVGGDNTSAVSSFEIKSSKIKTRVY